MACTTSCQSQLARNEQLTNATGAAQGTSWEMPPRPQTWPLCLCLTGDAKASESETEKQRRQLPLRPPALLCVWKGRCQVAQLLQQCRGIAPRTRNKAPQTRPPWQTRDRVLQNPVLQQRWLSRMGTCRLLPGEGGCCKAIYAVLPSCLPSPSPSQSPLLVIYLEEDGNRPDHCKHAQPTHQRQ